MHTSKSEFLKKPFPWRCKTCREQAVYETVLDYVGTRFYDSGEITVKVPGLKTPKCVKCGQVAPDDEALVEIERAFAAELERQAATRKSA
jgi:hypothetical protein